MPAILRSPLFWMRLISLCVVVSVALGLARLTWRVVGWDDGRSEVWTPAALAPLGGPASGNLAAILAYAPFGGGAGGGLAASSLGLALKGIVYQASGVGSAALIAAGGGAVQTFVVGQAPIGNAVIESIQIDHVVLNSGGRREILALPKPAGGAPGSVASGTAPASGAVQAPSVSTASPTASPSPEAAASLAASSPIATAAARASEGRTPPPSAVVRPTMTPGSLGISSTPQGYVVGADSAPQLLRAGLKPGDVVKSVNGQALGNPATDQQTFERAAAGGRARVEIIRDGRTVTLTVPLR